VSSKLPSGTVTFLFTDIEGSTSRWEHDPVAMSEALKRHDAVSSEDVAAADGVLFKMTGDGCCAAFSDADSAARAALALRDHLAAEKWPAGIGDLKVRMALHTGLAEERDGDYFGPTLNRVARLMAAGHGGQVLLSETTRRLLDDESLRIEDLGEHRLRDLLRSEHIYELSPLDERHPPLRVLNARTHNLPVQVTPFIGREQALAELVELVESHHLVTLTGPGGTGKTRLALQAAAELTDSFEGVYFVTLAPVRDADGVGPAITDAIGLQLGTPDSVVDVIGNHLATRRVLLVLDNFEHVMAAAPLVGSILDAAADARIVVTSREVLRLRAERHYPVAPFATPAVTPGLTVDQLSSFEAVRLFAERASAARPDFALGESNIHDVAAICAMLDGLPLAIELAAARVRLFTPHQLRPQLEKDLKLLGGGPVDAPQRHQTLMETIKWSYDLLTDGEQTLFRRMAVFLGGRSLDAMAAVCLPGINLDVMSAAEALADKSLARIEQGSTGEMRLEVLGTIYGFARARLEESGEFEDLQRRHAEYFARVAESAEPEMRGRDQATWFARLEDERPNFEAALGWSFDGGDPVVGMRIVAALRDFWFYQGHNREMNRWVGRALPVSADADDALRAAVLLAACFNRYMGADVRAIDLVDKATRLYAKVGDDAHRALALIWKGGALAELQGDVDGARRSIEEGLVVAEEAGAAQVIAQGLNMSGEIERAAGNYEVARHIQQECLAVSHQTGEQRRVAMVTHNLGLIAHHLGDDDEADRLLRESLELSSRLRFDAQSAHCLLGLAEQVALRGDPAGGAQLIGAGDAWFELFGATPQPADAPDYDRIRADLEAALGPDRYQEEVARGAKLDLEAGVALAGSLR
jgi:predicted ATPase/class 3 adenylate cyclase